MTNAALAARDERSELKKDKAIGRAEALRRAMLAVIEDHPGTPIHLTGGHVSIVREGGTR